ncbi:Hypothetical protein CINCED_3A003771 [Cinara cedri]|nr:Hypothetical protein CINCED_3A003771 [Cinara cedri]
MSDGVVTGTRCPTGHFLLIDARFELPFGPYDPPTGWKEILGELSNSNTAPPSASASGDNDEMCDIVEYQKKIEILNTFDQDSRSEEASAQFPYYGHSAGNSEDSDYTSDFNYPICQQEANSSASQFRNLADQLELSPSSSPEHPNTKSVSRSHNPYESQRYEEMRVPDDDMSYNSRPKNYKDHKRRKSDYKIGSSKCYVKGTPNAFPEWYSQSSSSSVSRTHSCRKHVSKYQQRKTNKNRRSSLERQTSVYRDRPSYYEDFYHNRDQFEPYDNKPNLEQVIPYGPVKYFNGPSEEIYNYDNSYSYADQKEEDSQWDGGGPGEYYYSPESSSDTQQLKTTYPVQPEVDEDNEEVYFSPNQSYEDRHYHEHLYELSPPAVPAQRHKQLPEIPTKKSPYIDYYLNHYYNEQMTPSSTGPKKILPQIPQSRIKPSPSLPHNYQKVQRRNSIDQRSSSLDHKDNENYEYTDNLMSKGQFEEYDDGYYNDSVKLLQQDQQPQYEQHNLSSLANAKIDYEIKRDIVQEEKKDENEGFTRRDTFKKLYQKTVKTIETPCRSFFQQHTDSVESQEEHKEESFETAVSSVSTSNRRWMQETSSLSKPNSYEQYKPKVEDAPASVVYTLRPQESTESYQDELIPAEDKRDNEEQESPRVLPEVPTSASPAVVDNMYSSPIKHFAPMESLEEEPDDEDRLDLLQEDEKQSLTEESAVIVPPAATVAPEEKSNLARMRWHKAYNKIVHQLNVST